MTIEDRKRAQVEKMSTEAIRTILDTLSGPELEQPTAAMPLGGKVHLTGIGQVTVTMLRQVYAERTK